MTSNRGVTVFFGTPAAAIPSLDALQAQTDVSFVVTRPDKRRGRSGRPRPPAIKEAALERELAVRQPQQAADIASDLAGVDLAVVVAYGQILPEYLLAVPRVGFVNVHFSLLPRWRGAAPVARAILAADKTTGVTLMQMDAGMDTGEIIDSRTMAIKNADSAGSLTDGLAELGASLLSDNLGSILASTATFTRQGHEETMARKLTSDEARLDPRTTGAEALRRMVRAFNPKPGAWGIVDGERLKIWDAEPTSAGAAQPGDLTVVDGSLCLGTEDGLLKLLTVQSSGGKRMSGLDWANGHRGTWQLD